MRRVRALSSAAALLACGTAFGQQAAAPIRVDVRLVHILASVKDQYGAPVGSLEKADFEVRDNGVLQQIAVFERQTEQPLSIAVMVDASGSTAKDLKYETDSVTRFVRAVVRSGNPQDTVSLYSFNWQVVQQTGFTRDPAKIDHQLRLLHGEAGTAMYDAILLGARDIENRPGRKVLVIITDGGDTTSRTSFNRAAEAAQLADAVIYPVLVVPIANDAGRNTGGENALTTLAQRTGGQVFQPALGAELDKAFDGILRNLRTQYLLEFYPHNVPVTTERFHLLTVTPVGPGADASWKVSARSGYYGEALAAPRPAQENPSQNVDVTPADETMRLRKPKPAPGAKPATGNQTGKGSN
jgi:Ca-activated chloride channel family protein